MVEQKTTHGQTGSPEYRSWQAMLNRCYRTEDISYENYGGKGITVCDEWIDSFEKFYEDMKTRPTLQHSLDRIDGSLGYCAANCRWATREEQQNNTRANRMITYKGKTQSAAQWARETGLNRSVIIYRLNRGWTPEEILENT